LLATGLAGIEMGDDRLAHAWVPELGDALGNFCRAAEIRLS
jgi:hypothetical protein